MSLFTRFGAPVEIVAAEKRRRWGVLRSGRYDIYDAAPTAKQTRGSRRVEEFDMWWVRLKVLGPYPDGSGANRVGTVNDRFVDENELRADDGIREIHAACEAAAKAGG